LPSFAYFYVEISEFYAEMPTASLPPPIREPAAVGFPASDARPDFLIIGGGVLGLAIALACRRAWPEASVILLEKEARCGEHASGRNSGVLHAGFYYTPDSLKARFAAEGNRRLTAYCRERGLRVLACGKLVVARNAAEVASLETLLERGRANGVPLEPVTHDEARRIEPRVKTCGRALFSPTTVSVDPGEVVAALAADAQNLGVRIHSGEGFLGRTPDGVVRTARARYAPGYVINAAGLQADRVARAFGFSRHYRILPFKGLYRYSNEPTGAVRTHIYPVPDLRHPFLGVHYTLTVDGRIKIGPTALPALWREQYGGRQGFSARECLEILARQTGLLVHAGFDFRRLAWTELRKQSRHHMAALAGELLEGVHADQFRERGRPGIRAQLIDLRTRRLEMDFVLEGDARSLHVLNAVSPGFTCALPFADHVRDAVARHLQTPIPT
jgi:L-2-hydroxyglutarate oxidase LhgO